MLYHLERGMRKFHFGTLVSPGSFIFLQILLENLSVILAPLTSLILFWAARRNQVVPSIPFLEFSSARSSGSLDIFLIFHINPGKTFVKLSATSKEGFPFLQFPVKCSPPFYKLSLMVSTSLFRLLLVLC